MMYFEFLVFIALGVSSALGARDGLCPPLGPVLPAPITPSSHPRVQSALDEFGKTLHNVTSSLNVSAVSVGLRSIHEDQSLLEWHYTPPSLNTRGVKKVDSDTVYRLASTSKLFPVLAILKTPGMDLHDPITDYLPELRDLNEEVGQQDVLWTVDWDDITLSALASHLGAPADLVTDLTTDLDIDWTDIGFPRIEDSILLNCSMKGTPACPKKVFWNLFSQRAPVFPPFTSSVYSNVAFTLLGWAVEAFTNRTFSEYLKENIWTPTGMEHTFATKPDDRLGAIPVNATWWEATMGFEKAAGDYYSSLSDMLAFGASILKNEQLSAVRTRRWMKPVASTSASNLLLGTPWEIYRFTNVTADGRLIEIYTKMGNIFDYNSNLVLVPDYGLVFDVLTAGPETSGSTILTITNAALKTILPALEEAGKTEAHDSYAGVYTDVASNSSITLSLDDEGPGFRVSNWFVRGTDVLKAFSKIETAFTHIPEPEDEVIRFRMYPSGIETETRSSWRGVFTLGSPEDLAEAESEFIWPMATCNTWAQLDRNQYGLQSQDHFVFTVEESDGGKRAVSVELPAYRVTLQRQPTSLKPLDPEGTQKVLS